MDRKLRRLTFTVFVLFVAAGLLHGQVMQQALVNTKVPVSGASFTLVQTTTCQNLVASTVTCTFGSAITAGNSVWIMAQSDASTSCSATDPGLNTWTSAVDSAQASGGWSHGLYSIAVAGGTNNIVLVCSLANAVAASLGEVSGITALDQVGSNTATANGITVTTIGSVTAGTEYVVAQAADWNAFQVYTKGTGYTIRSQVYQNGGMAEYTTASEDNDTQTGLSGTVSATLTGNSSTNKSAIIMTFR